MSDNENISRGEHTEHQSPRAEKILAAFQNELNRRVDAVAALNGGVIPGPIAEVWAALNSAMEIE